MQHNLIPCGKTGAYHRIFDKDTPDEPRKSIGAICPACGIELFTHSEAFVTQKVEEK